MQIPVQVTFRHMSVPETVESQCWKEAEKLERYFDRITGCRVVIEQPHRHHRKGNLYQVRIDLTVPGSEIVVNREPPAHQADEDIQVAVREAFDTARRELEDYVRRMRGQVKPHDVPTHATVARLFPNDGYGFLRTPDGREVYFHRNSVLGGAFEALAPGTHVSYREEDGEKGPQATSIRAIERSSSGIGN